MQVLDTHILGNVCNPVLVINNLPLSPTNQLYEATSNIMSDAIIGNGLNINYEAGVEVNLLSDFEVVNGATFLAEISPCF